MWRNFLRYFKPEIYFPFIRFVYVGEGSFILLFGMEEYCADRMLNAFESTCQQIGDETLEQLRDNLEELYNDNSNESGSIQS